MLLMLSIATGRGIRIMVKLVVSEEQLCLSMLIQASMSVPRAEYLIENGEIVWRVLLDY